MHMPSGTKFVDESVIEAEFGFEPGTFMTMRRTGRGPIYYRFGERTVFYERSEVAAWIEQSKRKPVSEHHRPMGGDPAPDQVAGTGRTTQASARRVSPPAIHDARTLQAED